jgi:hypothetical protein
MPEDDISGSAFLAGLIQHSSGRIDPDDFGAEMRG